MTLRWFRVWLALALLTLMTLAGGAQSVPSDLTPPELLDIKLKAIARINLDRYRHKLPPVEYDEVASRVADEHCREILANKVISHWSQDGRKPYMRYAWAGGRDAVHENLAHVVGNLGKVSQPGAKLTELLTLELNRLQDGFMAEQPPNDGHRRNILTPTHTHVGIGLAFHRQGVCYAQEFVARYVTVEPLPTTAQLTDKLVLKGQVSRPGYEVHSIQIFYEPLPQALSLEQLNQTDMYGLPAESFVLRPQAPEGYTYADGTTGEIHFESGGKFKSSLKFFREQPGVYTVVVWLKGQDQTEGVQATTISIKVPR